MNYVATEWNVYRTRFLVRARQLTEPLVFVDALGREHQGDIGDYVVESSDGSCRIARQEIFEDIYVAMGPADDSGWRPSPTPKPLTTFNPAPGRSTAQVLLGNARPACS